MTGINIQIPWSRLLVDGLKSIETRSYPIPVKLKNKEMALIETPGRSGKCKSRIIGTITFSHSFLYKDQQQWESDFDKHLVDPTSTYNWNGKPKYGWVVSKVKEFKNPVDPPKRRGIIYAKGCLA